MSPRGGVEPDGIGHRGIDAHYRNVAPIGAVRLRLVRLTVSAVLPPFEFRRGQAGASDIKRHGASSSMRARGQPLTRRVRSSAR